MNLNRRSAADDRKTTGSPGGAAPDAPAGTTRQPFGVLPDGREATLFTLTNAAGLRADITNYGGTLVRLFTPDRAGRMADITLGFNTLAEYTRKDHSPYFGCLIGRVGNRLARGRFSLAGQTYTLATNNVCGGIPCHLHGGLRGFDKVLWQAAPVHGPARQGVRLDYVSPAGEEGYPGNLKVTVTYWLTDANELRLEYRAVTDKATPFNPTQHAYFNLKGEGEGDILGHQLALMADRFTTIGADMIPTGTLQEVRGTPLDFTVPHAIGERIGAEDEQLRFGAGYDHNFVLRHQDGELQPAAVVTEPATGRRMDILTTEPGIQFYSGNFLPPPGATDAKMGKSGRPYSFRHGFCLETQHFPDSPNQRGFPSTLLQPGMEFSSVTVHRFSAKDDA